MPKRQNRFNKEAGLFDSPIINPDSSLDKKKSLKKWDDRMTKRWIAIQEVRPEIKYFGVDFENWARDVFGDDTEEFSAAVKLAKKLSKTEALLFTITSMMSEMAKTGEVNTKEARAFEQNFIKLAQDAGFEVDAGMNEVCQCEDGVNCPNGEQCQSCDACELKRQAAPRAAEEDKDKPEEDSEKKENPFFEKEESDQLVDSEPKEEAKKEDSEENSDELGYDMEYSLEQSEGGKYQWKASATGTGYDSIEDAEKDLNHIFKNAIDRMDLEEEVEEQLEEQEELMEDEGSTEFAKSEPVDASKIPAQEIAHQSEFADNNEYPQEIAHQEVTDDDSKAKWLNLNLKDAPNGAFNSLEAAFEEAGIFSRSDLANKTMKVKASSAKLKQILEAQGLVLNRVGE
jgi:polyhydroxyalkanoate synthesis regulator phasin